MFRAGPLTAVLAIVLASAGANEARAAYLPPSFGDEWHGGDAASAGDRSSAASSPIRPADLPVAPDDEGRQRQVAAAAAPGSMGGVGSPASSVGPMPAAPLAAGDGAVDGGQLTDYFVRECRCVFPVPFLNGVFRPPRV